MNTKYYFSFDQVIVRDVVSKSVIAQFKAHDSSIASLCFDPSGTLLVTASVHGHNFNVFRIIPGAANGASYIHLYKLQRGFTNAVCYLNSLISVFAFVFLI